MDDTGTAAAEPTTVGILGGTGALGRALGQRFAAAGLTVVLGSRSAQRAADAATGLDDDVPGRVLGADNHTCAERGGIVVVAVPWDGHGALLADLADVLAGKVVVDCVNPLGFDADGPHALVVPDGSACEQAQRLLPDSRVTGAFHHLSAAHLLDTPGDRLDADVLVVGDDERAVQDTIALAGLVPGVRGVHAGRLRDARQVEALTANLIAVNRRYGTRASLRVTGLPQG